MSQNPGEDAKTQWNSFTMSPPSRSVWRTRAELLITQWMRVTWKCVWGGHWDAGSSLIFLVLSILLNHGWIGRKGIHWLSGILKKKSLKIKIMNKKSRNKLNTPSQNYMIKKTSNSYQKVNETLLVFSLLILR